MCRVWKYVLINNFFIDNNNINETVITTIDLNIWTYVHVTHITLILLLLLNHRYTRHCTSTSYHDCEHVITCILSCLHGHSSTLDIKFHVNTCYTRHYYFMYMYHRYTDTVTHGTIVYYSCSCWHSKKTKLSDFSSTGLNDI